MVETAVTAAPVATSQRIEVLDVLRGFALLGVLLVDVQFFVRPSYAALMAGSGAGHLDRAALWFVDFAAQGKFFPIFSLLFGYGIALQMASAARRGGRFLTFISWRLLILMWIGLVHMFYLWDGDILAMYALLGFLLLPFRNASDRALIAVGAVCLLAWPLSSLALRAFLDLGSLPADTAGRLEAAFAENGENRRVIRETLRMMSMFFVGFAAGRRNLFAPGRLLPQIVAPVAGVCLLVGAVGNALAVGWASRLDPSLLTWSWVAMTALVTVAAPVLAVGYIATIVHLSFRAGWRKRLAPLAPVGRMALTNYLLQTICLLAIVSAIAKLGWGAIYPPAGIALAFGLFGAQIAFSRWWLGRFRFGPMEWAWRSLSYGRRQPLRIQTGEG